MPWLTRWYIKLALLYLLLALTGVVWQAAGGGSWLLPVSVHAFVVGWITGMIFGVAYWMFPRATPDRPRGNDAIALSTFVLLQLGLAVRLVAEPLATLHPGAGWGAWLVVSAVCQWLGAVGFVLNTWPRVRAR
jgi:hypothetical protein